MESNPQWKSGLLQQAHNSMLYVDEVNLLDDHIVNIILDVTSTGVLEVQREGHDVREELSFILVGTMNPEEGGLRPQLLDRFGLMANVKAETDPVQRSHILETVMAHDKALFNPAPDDHFILKGREDDEALKDKLNKARAGFNEIEVPTSIFQGCVALADAFKAEGHRGDLMLALAACALAALEEVSKVTREHLLQVKHLALQHRRPEVLYSDRVEWTEKDDQRAEECLSSYV